MSGPRVRVAAQAKLNLHLRVLSREESGFHSIETVFHRIDLADDLVVEARPDGRTIDVAGADVGPAESNLAWRAAVVYADHTGWPSGFSIELTKKIPAGAGLGGGSADAAAVLRALNSMAPNPVGAPGLLRLASTLGSDVPFLAGSSVMALAWGRGERMLSLNPLSRHDVLLMSPAFSVSTADAYRWLDERREMLEVSAEPQPADPVILDAISLSTWASIARFARNDFEAPVAERFPQLREFLDQLKSSRAILSGMTGSGSTIFGILDTPPDYSKVPAEHRERVTTTTTSIDVSRPERVG
ncbi:MAG: 4-(cytidine 5'-diphospho)-2-C-methyl-D-erythritol kinase [Gemmatimonadaceae bacterium]